MGVYLTPYASKEQNRRTYGHRYDRACYCLGTRLFGKFDWVGDRWHGFAWCDDPSRRGAWQIHWTLRDSLFPVRLWLHPDGPHAQRHPSWHPFCTQWDWHWRICGPCDYDFFDLSIKMC